MKLKKVTDFIKLEEGNIGRKSAVVTGALLASSIVGAVLVQQVSAIPYCHDQHFDSGHSDHDNSYYDSHYNVMPPQPCHDPP